MNIADQFKNVNWKDIGNAAPGPKIVALLLLLAGVVAAGWYGYWDGLNEELAGAKVKESRLKEDYKVKKQKAVNLSELKKQLVQVGQRHPVAMAEAIRADHRLERSQARHHEMRLPVVRRHLAP